VRNCIISPSSLFGASRHVEGVIEGSFFRKGTHMATDQAGSNTATWRHPAIVGAVLLSLGMFGTAYYAVSKLPHSPDQNDAGRYVPVVVEEAPSMPGLSPYHRLCVVDTSTGAVYAPSGEGWETAKWRKMKDAIGESKIIVWRKPADDTGSSRTNGNELDTLRLSNP
jgi:hypothetical protein